jgi:hypothetical protein
MEMAGPRQEEAVSPFQILDLIERFVSENARSKSVEMRFLAAYLQTQPSPVLRAFHNGSIDPAIKSQVDQFRRDEISNHKAELRAEIERLDNEDRDLARASERD